MVHLFLLVVLLHVAVGLGSAPCQQGVIQLNVFTTEDALELSHALLCSGAGQFHVDWDGHVALSTVIAVGNGSTLDVRGSSPSDAVIDGGASIQLFRVSDKSKLLLHNVSLVKGYAWNGAAVYVGADSYVSAVDCTFAHNDAFEFNRVGEV